MTELQFQVRVSVPSVEFDESLYWYPAPKTKGDFVKELCAAKTPDPLV